MIIKRNNNNIHCYMFFFLLLNILQPILSSNTNSVVNKEQVYYLEKILKKWKKLPETNIDQIFQNYNEELSSSDFSTDEEGSTTESDEIPIEITKSLDEILDELNDFIIKKYIKKFNIKMDFRMNKNLIKSILPSEIISQFLMKNELIKNIIIYVSSMADIFGIIISQNENLKNTIQRIKKEFFLYQSRIIKDHKTIEHAMYTFDHINTLASKILKVMDVLVFYKNKPKVEFFCFDFMYISKNIHSKINKATENINIGLLYGGEKHEAFKQLIKCKNKNLYKLNNQSYENFIDFTEKYLYKNGNLKDSCLLNLNILDQTKNLSFNFTDYYNLYHELLSMVNSLNKFVEKTDGCFRKYFKNKASDSFLKSAIRDINDCIKNMEYNYTCSPERKISNIMALPLLNIDYTISVLNEYLKNNSPIHINPFIQNFHLYVHTFWSKKEYLKNYEFIRADNYISQIKKLYKDICELETAIDKANSVIRTLQDIRSDDNLSELHSICKSLILFTFKND